jgi:primosomal replication protein N''
MSYVRPCPRCGDTRPAEEFFCEGKFRDQACGWPLIDVLPVPEAAARTEPSPKRLEAAAADSSAGAASGRCRNGHPMDPGEFMCMVCGEPTATEQTGSTPEKPPDTTGNAPHPRVVNGWILGTELGVISGESDLFLASKEPADGTRLHETAVFKHYRRGIEPEASLYPALRTLDPDHGLRLLDAGRSEDRAFEVWEYLPLGTLGAIPVAEKAVPEFVHAAVREIGSALHGLAQMQIIHRDLKPANVLVRSREPLDLVLADFSTATVSEFDLQLTMTRQTTRYAAPETIAGTCSAASDWWSLGVIVLEMLTQGRGFEGVHERAFLLHLVTRGLRVPDDLPEEWRELLMGLLTRDPSRRWAWPEVERWLGGERGIPNGYRDDNAAAAGQGQSIRIGERAWSTPESFALAAAESSAWDEARALLLAGRLATWLQERGGERDISRAAQVRSLAADNALPEDARLAAALLTLNENLPLCLHGEIITPAWVLSHPDVALAWLDSPLPTHLRRMGREAWFVRLRERADRVRARLRETGIECDQAQLSAALLATSRSMLETRWRERRRLYPEAEQPALASTVERRTPTEEDLIILVAAPLDAFRPATDVLDEAEREATRAEVIFSRDEAAPWFEQGRREILDALNERLGNFVRCGRETADQWADDFRQDRRITLARALVLLSLRPEEWREPPRQEYVRNVLDFFHRRLVTGLQRGGLVRMTIGRTTARLDLTELAGPARSAEAILEALLTRQSQPVPLDPTPLLSDPQREQRLRRLSQNASAYRRDTGINALYLGFPFVTLRDARAGEATKPRIAPVLLWPVRLEMPAGARGTVRLSFDAERDEVRVNPALEGLLGSLAPAWREVLDDLRGRDHLELQAALDALVPLAALLQPAGDQGHTGSPRLSSLPPATVRVAAGQIQLHASAVLFHSDFSGQTIAEDLKQLAMRPIQGTALEVAIRAGMVQSSDEPLAPPVESDRYFTAASDPSQQAAVFRARQAPGLVVQGPPGTGKSQTIVNVVCDAIGRGERVLIVCQKLAALDVVRKRLEAEGLAERLFFLKDAVSDRRPALQALREQLEQPVRTANDDAQLQFERESLARHIEALEKELNGAHTALRETSPDRPGHLSYRELLDRLIEVERGQHPPVSFAPLGAALGQIDYAAAEQLIAEIAPLTPLWREAKYEDSPLHCLADFRTDEATLGDFREAFEALRTAEARREEILRQSTRFFDIETPDLLQRWLTEHEAALRALPPVVAQSLARWAEIFTPASPDQAPAAEQLIPWLELMAKRMLVLDGWTLEPVIYEKLASRGTAPLQRLSAQAERLTHPPRSIFARLNLGRWIARRRLNQWLRAAGVDSDAIDLSTLHAAAELELNLRKHRPSLQQWREALGDSPTSSPEPLPVMRAAVKRLLERLQPVIAAARRVQVCPLHGAAEELRHGGDPQACASVLDVCRASLALWAATRESDTRLHSATMWFDPAWIAERQLSFTEHRPASSSMDQLATAFPTLPAFQTFRLRASVLNRAAFPIFTLLRMRDEVWQRVAIVDLPNEIMRTLRREALLAWKFAAEKACPALLMERDELEQKVRLLGQKDDAMREANRRLLTKCSARAEIANRSRWDDVVMLTGQRARRLREVVERGDPLGLFKLRPVWMVNPEMASRLFPLQAGLFDLVIFDEASQLPVECVLPGLFRAKRVVVSGDEKQMPPSRFFGSQLDSDEEEGGDEWLNADDERFDETERERLTQAAGRREVKDCTDLLALTQNLLPTATLEIHYRSKYRQLIDFSNAAFYSGRLNVPARHPASEVRRAKPIEVDRVNGRYADQTNETEADRVVHRLRELWRAPAGQRPSVGVVTFNLKQADLIQDRLETLAEEDDDFRREWEVEQARTQRGEDMGFFVKNLENVQGDERDWIIFSTTFGRDAAGTFRRNFGVLGQHGGERRLNVAVTRAREKVLLVTSLPVNEISTWTTNHGRRPPSIPRDFLQGWLAYAERLHAGELDAAADLLSALNEGGERTERTRNGNHAMSPLTEDVAAFLRRLGHEPVAAAGDAFGVDFALIDPRTGLFGLGVECDAPSHPVLKSARARELWRPSVLTASIPVLHRVGSRAWYHNQAAEQERLRTAVHLALGT